MGLSRKFREKIDAFSPDEIDCLVRMGWEDRCTFESIKIQFGLYENEFIRLMRSKLSPSVFERWRKRVHNQGHLKHELKRGFKTKPFKSFPQSLYRMSIGWKYDISDTRRADNRSRLKEWTGI